MGGGLWSCSFGLGMRGVLEGGVLEGGVLEGLHFVFCWSAVELRSGVFLIGFRFPRAPEKWVRSSHRVGR